jgi:hypothetical protein
VSGPYDEEPCSVVKFHPALAGLSGSRAPVSQVKAMDGAKSLDAQHPRTRRRREGGTLTKSADETGEIRLGTGVNVAGRQPAMSGSGETYKQRTCEVVERRAEVGGGRSSEEGWDNTTHPSEGPLARCAHRPVRGERDCPLGYSPACGPPEIRHGRLGHSSTSWRCGMRTSDGLGESRMKENFMSGSGRGCWKRSSPTGHLRVPGRRAERCHHNDLVGTQPVDPLPPRQRPTSPSSAPDLRSGKQPCL